MKRPKEAILKDAVQSKPIYIQQLCLFKYL